MPTVSVERAPPPPSPLPESIRALAKDREQTAQQLSEIGLSEHESEAILKNFKAIEERLKASYRESEERSQQAIDDLSALYEHQLEEHARQLTERDREIATLRQGDNTLNASVEQLRAANLQLREEMAVTITSAVTAEVSKRTKDMTAEQIQGAGRTTQVKSFALAIFAALVSSGALVQIAQSCSEKPKDEKTTPAPGPGYGGRS